MSPGEVMTQAELQKHIYKTYFLLRVGLCLLAFVFPFLLWGIGAWNNIPLQNSISDYYFAFAPPTSPLRAFPGRVVFGGVLFVLGFFLILYRGFSKTENWALNIAGLIFFYAFFGGGDSLCLHCFCCLGLHRGNLGSIA
jgi:hypothetical protein